MKITRGQLKQIIKEEIVKTMKPLNENMNVQEEGCGHPSRQMVRQEVAPPAGGTHMQQERAPGRGAVDGSGLDGLDNRPTQEILMSLAKRMGKGDPQRVQEYIQKLQQALSSGVTKQ